jgi:hypothetical protein
MLSNYQCCSNPVVVPEPGCARRCHDSPIPAAWHRGVSLDGCWRRSGQQRWQCRSIAQVIVVEHRHAVSSGLRQFPRRAADTVYAVRDGDAVKAAGTDPATSINDSVRRQHVSGRVCWILAGRESEPVHATRMGTWQAKRTEKRLDRARPRADQPAMVSSSGGPKATPRSRRLQVRREISQFLTWGILDAPGTLVQRGRRISFRIRDSSFTTRRFRERVAGGDRSRHRS